ncbi:CLUMA_CG009347, isoform A [Clunio marinus]|uniref:CLUMA_CG009347, isoform A n=1 Tax=Clunio marinus TaxID=568069 RepID=A0A1J1I6I1_9DIPT|nr:CLUMA_CG009347, isoform A [Clunio marinus]
MKHSSLSALSRISLQEKFLDTFAYILITAVKKVITAIRQTLFNFSVNQVTLLELSEIVYILATNYKRQGGH